MHDAFINSKMYIICICAQNIHIMFKCMYIQNNQKKYIYIYTQYISFLHTSFIVWIMVWREDLLLTDWSDESRIAQLSGRISIYPLLTSMVDPKNRGVL